MVSKLLAAAAVVAGLSLAPTAFAAGLWNDTVPSPQGNAIGASPNSLPPGFESGTVQGFQAQSIDHWFASQGYRQFSTGALLQPHG